MKSKSKSRITHNCDNDVYKVTGIFYVHNVWWLELGFGSTAIEYCPFCGIVLRGTEDDEDHEKKAQVKFSTEDAAWLCFRHAIERAIAGEDVQVEVDNTITISCVDCEGGW